MAETRLYEASQGLMQHVDEVNHGWVLLGLILLLIFFLIGYLITMRVQRQRAEQLRARHLREQRKLRH
ncbi:MAG: hypothetical protein HQM03_18785 [Magnetococcales bacterium]|nr:hypothetical protein [Magnetococcales bacterium]